MPASHALMMKISAGDASRSSEPTRRPAGAPSIGLPIDHILVRPPAHIDTLTRMKDSLGSNHFGLIKVVFYYNHMI